MSKLKIKWLTFFCLRKVNMVICGGLCRRIRRMRYKIPSFIGKVLYYATLCMWTRVIMMENDLLFFSATFWLRWLREGGRAVLDKHRCWCYIVFFPFLLGICHSTKNNSRLRWSPNELSTSIPPNALHCLLIMNKLLLHLLVSDLEIRIFFFAFL